MPDAAPDGGAVLQLAHPRRLLEAARPVGPRVLGLLPVDPLPRALLLHVREADPQAQDALAGEERVPEEPLSFKFKLVLGISEFVFANKVFKWWSLVRKVLFIFYKCLQSKVFEKI